MKKLSYRIILTFLLILSINILLTKVSYSQVSQEWVRRYSGISSSGSQGKSIKLDSESNVYVLVSASTDTSSNDYCVIKYSPSGTLLWQAIYNSPGNANDNSKAFTVTHTGDVYITGIREVNLEAHILTVKFNSIGQFQWAKIYNGGGPGDGAFDIILDREEKIIVTGSTSVDNNNTYSLTIKYTSIGDTLWVRKFTQNSYSVNVKLAADDSDNVYTTGYHNIAFMQSNYLTLKYNKNGVLVWYSSYGLQPIGGGANCIAIDSSRNIYVAGNMYTLNPGYSDNALVKINPNGDTAWTRIYKGIGGNNQAGQPKNITVTSDGNGIYYTTFCENGTGGGAHDIITLKYNSLGDSVWIRRYWGGVSGEPNEPATLKLDKLNNVYVAGSAYYPSGGDNYVTIKYLPDGLQQWVATFNGPLTNSGDYANDLIIDTNLVVYVTGTSSRQNNPFLWDAATIKYNQPIGINTNGQYQLPLKFTLRQNYPNPFNNSTVLEYEIPVKSKVLLQIYNSIGQLIKTLINGEQNASYYTIIFNAENLSSGIYFYQLIADNSIIETKKFILIK
jgi:hypothetical protein